MTDDLRKRLAEQTAKASELWERNISDREVANTVGARAEAQIADLRRRLAELSAKWREDAKFQREGMWNVPYGAALDKCADDLDALLVSEAGVLPPLDGCGQHSGIPRGMPCGYCQLERADYLACTVVELKDHPGQPVSARCILSGCQDFRANGKTGVLPAQEACPYCNKEPWDAERLHMMDLFMKEAIKLFPMRHEGDSVLQHMRDKAAALPAAAPDQTGGQ